MHTPFVYSISKTAGFLAGFAALSFSYAALPVLPPGDNRENVLFFDDFDYNTANTNVNAPFKGWSNLAAGAGKATLGVDPGGTGATAWYPSLNSDDMGVTSLVVLPTSLNIAEGPIAVYVRVRVDATAGLYNNTFNVQLTENAGSRYGRVQIIPGAQSGLFYLNSAGVTSGTYISAYTFPNTTTFVDFRLQMIDNGTGSMTLVASRYDQAAAAYVTLGSFANADINTGVFNKLSIWSANKSGGANRVYFDSVAVTQVGSRRAHVPSTATYLPSGTTATIQAALSTAPHVVVLGPGVFSGTTSVVLNSGYQLYGDPVGTTIPPITVTPGASGVILSNVTVSGAGVTFGPSSTVTRGNVFERLGGRITVTGATLTDNLFIHVAQININTTAGGYVRNNRFLRCKVQSSYPQLVIKGDAARNSYGNVFLWYNFLTPHGDATDISNQGDLTFVGVDAETWNQNNFGTNALFKVGRMGTFRVFTMNGGNHGAYKTGDFDVDADEFQLYNDRMEKIASPLIDYKLRSNNLRSLAVNVSLGTKVWENSATTPFRLKAFEGSGASVSTSTTSTLTPVWTASTGTLPASPINQETTLKNMIVPTRAGSPWESPQHSPIPDPAGANWATLPPRGSQPDDAPMIQNLLDTSVDGMARLPAGTYYIGVPLKVRRNHGIIGAGADTTVIIAKTAIDMIVADDPVTDPTNSRIVLTGLTLQGGANGIHFEPIGTSAGTQANPGRFAQYTNCYINHVTFRDMTNAGIFMDRIYALDNILFSYVHFVNCDTGLKQLCDPLYTAGETTTMMYMDKVVFYKSQFVNNRVAMDLVGKRGCNLNAWINCLFQNNSGVSAISGAARMENYLSPVFANCDFINNGGSTATVTNNHTSTFVGCGFSAGANGVALLGGSVAVEGSSFFMGGSTTARIVRSSTAKVFFYNCTTPDMPLWTAAINTNSGMFMNNQLLVSDNLNKVAVSLVGTNSYVHVTTPTAGTPRSQLLFGSDWTVNPVLPLLSEF